MTYRDRREARLAQRLEWEEKRRQKAEHASESAGKLADMIPFGQPILVGHHSEGRHRRHIARIHNTMAKVVEHEDMANHHAQCAATISEQLDRSIYDDDPDAAAQLGERIAGLEAQIARRKIINREASKGPGWEGRLLVPLTAAETADLVSFARFWPGGTDPTRPYPSGSTTNLSARLRTARKRLAERSSHAEHV